jgi:hypothetical protein
MSVARNNANELTHASNESASCPVSLRYCLALRVVVA